MKARGKDGAPPQYHLGILWRSRVSDCHIEVAKIGSHTDPKDFVLLVTGAFQTLACLLITLALESVRVQPRYSFACIRKLCPRFMAHMACAQKDIISKAHDHPGRELRSCP